MKPCIYIHTNDKQLLGALVSKYSFERFAADKSAFDVELIVTDDYPFLAAKEGHWYLRQGLKVKWANDDLQSFTLLRFLPPALMNYKGRAVVVDPDVFCVSDITPLLERDMQGKAILARKDKADRSGFWSSSVMLLDNAKLRHWQLEKQFDAMLRYECDYVDWVTLQTEPQETIGKFESCWNDFDTLTPQTRMIHNTRRKTQPWKTGLKLDYRPLEKAGSLRPGDLLKRTRRALFGDYGMLGRYKPHPDPNQELLFFGLLNECLERGIVSEEMLRDHMRRNHIRHDAMQVLARTPALAERPLFAPATDSAVTAPSS